MNFLLTDLTLWRFPASAILAGALLLLLWAIDKYYTSTPFYRLLSSTQTAVKLTLALVTMLIAEGVWAWGLYHTIPFIAIALCLTTSLGLVTLRHLHRTRQTGFLLNHAGLFLILWASLFGAPDIIRARMVVPLGASETLAYTPSGEIIPLPFPVQLDRFEIDRHPDGSPRQFRASVRFGDHPTQIQVNSPARHAGYRFYQDAYDTREGRYTVLLVVRDPWLWIVWLGIALLGAGSLLMLFRK